MTESLSPEPREQSKRRYREAILDAAVDVFADKGYRDAQMSEIAFKAQVAVGTLYNFFTNKENLYREMLMSHVVDIAMEFNEIFESDDDPHTKLLRYIRHKGEILQSDSKLVRLYFSQVQAAELNTRATLSPEFREIYGKMIGQVAETFQRGIEQGLFVEADPYALAIALASMTNAFIRLWMNHPNQTPSYLDRVDSISQIFFGPVLRQIPPAPSGAGDVSTTDQGGFHP